MKYKIKPKAVIGRIAEKVENPSRVDDLHVEKGEWKVSVSFNEEGIENGIIILNTRTKKVQKIKAKDLTPNEPLRIAELLE
jgi:hypothetical protein